MNRWYPSPAPPRFCLTFHCQSTQHKVKQVQTHHGVLNNQHRLPLGHKETICADFQVCQVKKKEDNNEPTSIYIAMYQYVLGDACIW